MWPFKKKKRGAAGANGSSKEETKKLSPPTDPMNDTKLIEKLHADSERELVDLKRGVEHKTTVVRGKAEECARRVKVQKR